MALEQRFAGPELVEDFFIGHDAVVQSVSRAIAQEAKALAHFYRPAA
jgi:hypothetical protein